MGRFQPRIGGGRDNRLARRRRAAAWTDFVRGGGHGVRGTPRGTVKHEKQGQQEQPTPKPFAVMSITFHGVSVFLKRIVGPE